MEGKGSSLSESMAKSSSAGGQHLSTYLHPRWDNCHEGQWNFSVHLDLGKAFLGESILWLNHSLAQKTKKHNQKLIWRVLVQRQWLYSCRVTTSWEASQTQENILPFWACVPLEVFHCRHFLSSHWEQDPMAQSSTAGNTALLNKGFGWKGRTATSEVRNRIYILWHSLQRFF